MRISAKGRYALAAMIYMAQNHGNGEPVTVISISERLGISKIYLERVFSMLKHGGLVDSIKGAQGGYLLARMPQQITAYDVLSAVELSLFEATEDSVKKSAPEIEATMQLSVFSTLDRAVTSALKELTLSDLTYETEKHKDNQGLMFFI